MNDSQSDQSLKYISHRTESRVGIIEFNRPPINAIDDELIQNLSTILTRWRDDDAIRVIVLTGAVRNAFLSGADIDVLFGEKANADAKSLDQSLFRRIQQVFSDLSAMPQATIAAVNGLCLGAGLELALCCDLRVASELAFFGLPEINYGIITIAGTTQRLPWLIGAARAKELFLLGKRINAETALNWGLVNRLAPHREVLTQALALAQELALKSPAAVKAVKACADSSARGEFNRGVEQEIEAFLSLVRLRLSDESK